MLDTRLISRRVLTVNKAQLIDKLSAQLGSKKAATDAVDGVLDSITRAVAGGERVALTGFGVFEKVARPARARAQPAHRRSSKDQEDLGAEVQGRPELQGRRARRQEAAQGCGDHGPCGCSCQEGSSGKEGRRQEGCGQEGSRRRPAKKVAAKKAPAKKVVAKKVVARKAPAKKATARKTTAKKAVEALTAHRPRGPGDRVQVTGPSHVRGCEDMRSARVGKCGDREKRDAHRRPLALHAQAHPLSDAQQPQPTGVERVRVIGQLDAVVEQHRARPGHRVEVPHRRLHGWDPIRAALSAADL